MSDPDADRKSHEARMKLRKLLSTLWPVCVIALVGGFLWFGYSLSRFGIMETRAVEYRPEDRQPWLSGILQKRFNWTKLPPSSVENVWVEGFQDHTWFSRTHLAPDLFADLKRSVLATQGESVVFDDRDDLSLCPSGLATASPQLFEGSTMPSWWEAASLQKFDSVLWTSPTMGYWFAYDADRQLLFLLVYNT